MSANHPPNCLQESILPELNKMVVSQDRPNTFRAASQRSFTQLKSKPLSHFHDTYREAFKAKLFNPQQEYASGEPINPSARRQLFAAKSKKQRYGHVDRAIMNRIGFVCNSIRLIEDNLAQTIRDSKVIGQLAELFKFMHHLTEQISRSFAEVQQQVLTEQNKVATLTQKLAQMEQHNSHLHDYNQTLLKYDKGVNQLRLSHQNDKLRLEVEELTRVLTTKEHYIDDLNAVLAKASAKNDEYDSYKASIDIKLNKLKEELVLSEHTREQNLAMKMKYLLGLE